MITKIELRLAGLFGPPTVYQARMTAGAVTVTLATRLLRPSRPWARR